MDRDYEDETYDNDSYETKVNTPSVVVGKTKASKKGVKTLAINAKKSIAKTSKTSKASVTTAVKKARESLVKVVKNAKEKVVKKRKPKTVVEQLFFM